MSKAKELVRRLKLIAKRIRGLEKIDHVESPISRESDVLSSILVNLMESVEDNQIRKPTAVVLMETIIDLQEQALTEREEEIRKARSN